MNEITRLLQAAEKGEAHAAEELLPLVYDELRRLAAAKMAGERPGHTLGSYRAGSRRLPQAGWQTRVRWSAAVLCGCGRSHATYLGRCRPQKSR